jgi:hypothetical protein
VRHLIRRILDHQSDRLQDDANVVMLEWLTGDPEQMQL